jgi:glycerol uptake facilitator-like aquaporin
LKQDPFDYITKQAPNTNNLMSNSGNIYPNCDYDFSGQNKTIKVNDVDILYYVFNCSTSGYWFAGLLTELLGSFFVTFFFLTQTEEKTRFGKERAINCFIIAAAYVGARGMLNQRGVTSSGAVLNPAISIGTNFTMLFDHKSYFKYVWLYGLVPIGGAVLAVVFHELVFKKTQEVLAEDQEEDEGEDNLIDK